MGKTIGQQPVITVMVDGDYVVLETAGGLTKKILFSDFIKGLGGNLGDIAFLTKKEFGGKLRSAEGSVTTPSTLCTLTANTGKDMYLAGASCSMETTSGSAGTGRVELTINGVVVETVTFRTDADTAQIRPTAPYPFNQRGHKVLAGQIIKLEAQACSNATLEGNIECFEEDTGVDPTA